MENPSSPVTCHPLPERAVLQHLPARWCPYGVSIRSSSQGTRTAQACRPCGTRASHRRGCPSGTSSAPNWTRLRSGPGAAPCSPGPKEASFQAGLLGSLLTFQHQMGASLPSTFGRKTPSRLQPFPGIGITPTWTGPSVPVSSVARRVGVPRARGPFLGSTPSPLQGPSPIISSVPSSVVNLSL